MIVDGLLGLFVGPVLLAVSYVLLLEWLRQHPVDGRHHGDEAAL
jgi:predicted PurR-regulated permease PerM